MMDDDDIQKRLVEENIMSSIVHIRECVGTYISNDYILSAFHCSQKSNNTFDSIIGSAGEISNEYLFGRDCGDGWVNSGETEFSDFSLYKINAPTIDHTIIKPYWWGHDKEYPFKFEPTVRYIVYKKNLKKLYIVPSNIRVEVSETTNKNCKRITMNNLDMTINGAGGNSGGPLLAYIGDTFYLIAVLSIGGRHLSWYSPICNIKKDNKIYTAFGLDNNQYEYQNEVLGDNRAVLMSLVINDRDPA
jgi:hypothetical protein